MSKIFVETRGTSEVYNWFDAREGNKQQLPHLPHLVKNLADTEFESLVLYRESRDLILAITALKSGRTDNRTRPIRNSLIWIGDNDDEAKIRAIIIEYLEDKGKLEKQIADAITEKPEIKIDSKKIESIGNINNLETKQNSSQLDLDNKIGNLDKCKKELIDEIKNDSLPKKDGLLIFINYSKQKKTFEELKPWRGLSNNISSGGWITLGNRKTVPNEKKLQPPTSEKSLTKSNNIEGKQPNLLLIVLTIILVISNAFFFYQNNQLNQRINELEKKINQIENLQSVINKSKQDVETAKTNLENDIITANNNFYEAQKTFIKAQKQFNKDISDATTNYETKMGNVQQSLSDSVEKLN